MKFQQTIIFLTGALLLTGCLTKQQADAPNDTVSRGLNEMKAKPRAMPASADLRDSRIADLERRLSDADSELSKLRGASGNLTDANRRINDMERQLADADSELAKLRGASGSLTDANRRIIDMQRQLADRDRELASLQGSAGDKSMLASKLSSATGDLDQANRRMNDLERQLADKDRELAGMRGSMVAGTDLDAAKRRAADLEKQLAERDAELAKLRGNLSDEEKELARLRGELSAEMAKLKGAERGLIKALKPEIDKGNIYVDLNNERLMINLASAALFSSGDDQLKPAGADALKYVGGVLKDYPEYKVAVDGHTDNRPIRSALKKRFPTNKELSEARAANAVKALTAGGVAASTVSSSGYADTKPVAPNTTDAGRAKNRRVEVRVTPKS
jgi:chemotaxis protein MotB